MRILNDIPDDVMPVSGAVITPEDVEILHTVVDGCWYTERVYASRFARKISSVLGLRYTTLVNSGSSANLLAVTALKDYYKSPNNSLVITAATAFPTTVAPIIQNNLIPFFIDINPHTLQYNTKRICELLERDDVCGVILAHVLGVPYDACAISKKAIELHKWFVEDCCDALGSYRVGQYGDCATLSFFPAHHITSGEGGSVSTNNEEIDRLLKQYSSWGRDCHCLPGQDNACGKRFGHEWKHLPFGYDHKYTFTKVGYNLHMTEFQAALGLSQMERLPEFVEMRQKNYLRLESIIRKYDLYVNTVPYLGDVSPFGFPMICSSFAITDGLVEWLEDEGVKTRPIFAGNILKHPMMDGVNYVVDGKLDGSDFAMNRMFWVGCWPGLKDCHFEMFGRLLKEYFE